MCRYQCLEGRGGTSCGTASSARRIDQRMIKSWAGHVDENTNRRYRHLFPTVQKDAMRLIFDQFGGVPPISHSECANLTKEELSRKVDAGAIHALTGKFGPIGDSRQEMRG